MRRSLVLVICPDRHPVRRIRCTPPYGQARTAAVTEVHTALEALRELLNVATVHRRRR